MQSNDQTNESRGNRQWTRQIGSTQLKMPRRVKLRQCPPIQATAKKGLWVAMDGQANSGKRDWEGLASEDVSKEPVAGAAIESAGLNS